MRGAATPAAGDGRRGLFLSWAPFSRRTETLAAEFGLDARFMVTPWPKRPLDGARQVSLAGAAHRAGAEPRRARASSGSWTRRLRS